MIESGREIVQAIRFVFLFGVEGHNPDWQRFARNISHALLKKTPHLFEVFERLPSAPLARRRIHVEIRGLEFDPPRVSGAKTETEEGRERKFRPGPHFRMVKHTSRCAYS